MSAEGVVDDQRPVLGTSGPTALDTVPMLADCDFRDFDFGGGGSSPVLSDALFSSPCSNGGGDSFFTVDKDQFGALIHEAGPFSNQKCPDCNMPLTPQYFFFLKDGHCLPTETPPHGSTEPPQDWICCNPNCAVQGEFSTRCNRCLTPKLLRWIQDPKVQQEHYILECEDCKNAGRSGRKKGRKGAMCGRCVHCKAIQRGAVKGGWC